PKAVTAARSEPDPPEKAAAEASPSEDVTDEIVAALEPEAETAPEDADEPAAPTLGQATEEALDQVMDAARRDSVAWAERTQDAVGQAVVRLTGAWHAFWRDPIHTSDTWLAAAGLPDSRTLAAPAFGVLLVLVGLLFLLGGKGDLKVSIEYPAELRGTFSVRIARKHQSSSKMARTASPTAAERAKRNARTGSKTERHLVSRETEFHRVRMGRWFVVVDGFVQPPDDEAVIGTYFEERELKVKRGQTVRVDFDFRPKQCPVDVKVVWDKKSVPDARIAWRGEPHSLRYARGAPVRLGAERGEHILVVGAGDRIAELPVSIPNFQAISVEIDLADRERLVFTGCPPAVEPYLLGDLPAAARALEREGQDDVSHLVLAQLAEEQDHLTTAADHYAKAGDRTRAAEIHRSLENFETSAALYESAGELLEAAEMYKTAGETQKAGEAFEQAREFESAADCFREAGDVTKLCETLEKGGRPFEAAQIALEHGDKGRAIRTLQVLSPNDHDYVEGANLLIDVLEREGHLDLAVRKLEEIIRTRGADGVPIESCDKLARLLDENEQTERAIDVLEIIRQRDPAYPELASRLEALRKKRQQEKAASSGADKGFDGNARYEILEEIGRGGMGIVFKARDRRLGRVVALKKLPDNLRNHPKAVELFLREARASASLNHPNIVTVHDAGQEGEAFFMTMELMEGLPLSDILKRHGSLGARDVMKLAIQICAGLLYAHEARVIHRDIKTANLFFTRGKVVKIMDFGLAKMVEEVRRASTVIGGTPYYMAPEQSLGENVDARSDLYALGVTLFELLTGKVPFADGDVAYHHRHTAPPDSRDSVAGIPEELAELVLDLMAKEPSDRPQNAGLVSERLQLALEEFNGASFAT
ncbi:MAG: protein kinase domain-containing protein, partial [Myxococcota bacterium]